MAEKTTAQKDKEFMDKAKTISVKPGSKKKYLMDVKTIWDKEHDKPLVTADRDESGCRVVETNDTKLQGKLEKMGYTPNVEVRKMHQGSPAGRQGAKSRAEVA